MAYANLATATKLHRTNQIITDIGSGGFMNFYVGALPRSPDLSANGILLASLPLSSPAGVGSLALLGGSITAPGSGGTDGTYPLTITPAASDPGSGAIGIFTVVGGVLSTIQISSPGSGYLVPPTLGGFNFGGVSGATAVPVMTAILVFRSIGTSNGVSSGTTGFVRIVTSQGNSILDLDVGTTNGSSVVMNNTFILSGSPVTCVADVLIEG